MSYYDPFSTKEQTFWGEMCEFLHFFRIELFFAFVFAVLIGGAVFFLMKALGF